MVQAQLPELGVIQSHFLGGAEALEGGDTAAASGTTLAGLNPVHLAFLLLLVALAFEVFVVELTFLTDMELLEHESEEHVLSNDTLLHRTTMESEISCTTCFLRRCCCCCGFFCRFSFSFLRFAASSIPVRGSATGLEKEWTAGIFGI